MVDSGLPTFRNIELHDQDSLLRLRNSLSNLEFFKNPHPVSPEDHAQWFFSRITDFREHQIVGVLWDQVIGIAFLVPLEDHTCSISINIDPRYQSRGIGLELLMRMLIRAESLGFSRIEALIHVSNTKSVSLFERSGFSIDEKISEFFIRYVKSIEIL